VPPVKSDRKEAGLEFKRLDPNFGSYLVVARGTTENDLTLYYGEINSANRWRSVWRLNTKMRTFRGPRSGC